MSEKSNSKNKLFVLFFVLTILIIVIAVVFAVRHSNNVKAIEEAKVEKATLIVNRLYKDERLADDLTKTTLNNAKTATADIADETKKAELSQKIKQASVLLEQQNDLLEQLEDFTAADGKAFADDLTSMKVRALPVENISNLKMQEQALAKQTELIEWIAASDELEVTIDQLFTDSKQNKLAPKVTNEQVKKAKEQIKKIKNEKKRVLFEVELNKAEKLSDALAEKTKEKEKAKAAS